MNDRPGIRESRDDFPSSVSQEISAINFRTSDGGGTGGRQQLPENVRDLESAFHELDALDQDV
jgi:hypothetical protein